jgi:asparagine synthase (glutamine-hydrolysing)
MGGLTGFYSLSSQRNSADMLSNLRQMTATLAHRGPDNLGLWLDREAGIAIGQRRLAISARAGEVQQPLTAPSGRYTVAFDGEIYNHAALRKQLSLAGYTHWRSAADTETLLAAFTCWGIRRTLAACVGMFAIALWDHHTRRLTLMRDRMGEKPLHYGWMGQHFLFGSELKALQAHQAWDATISREAIASQLRLGYIPAPLTIYQQVFKLEAGHLVQITPATAPGSPPQPDVWWSLAEHITETRPTRSLSSLFTSQHHYADTLEQHLKHTVQQQMQADAPVGALLHGVSSSLIVALMQTQSNQPINTFNVAYHSTNTDAGLRTQAIAKHLGTAHTTFVANARDVVEIMPQLPTLFDEPYADISALPLLLVSQLASTNVNVALSGQGANELFGGHERYRYAHPLWRRWRSPEKAYRHSLSHWQHPEDITLGIQSTHDTSLHPPSALNIAERMMFMDTLGALPNNKLMQMDRASMSVSLETRSPFLDKRLVEFAWQLPSRLKIRNGQGKWLLNEVLKRYLPAHLCTPVLPHPPALRGMVAHLAAGLGRSLAGCRTLTARRFFRPAAYP